MTPAASAALASPVLRNAAGEPPLGIGGLAFRDDQGEIIEHDIASYRNGLTKLGVLQLEDGEWLAYPFRCDGELFPSREAALASACDALVSKALKFRDNKDGDGTKWTEAYANAIIDWATGLKPPQAVRYRVSVQFSGGAASYIAAKLALEEFGHDGVALIFADTLIEDEDLYRFLKDAEERLQHPIIRISEGRDPWTVFFDERMMGNSRVDPCSKILKRKLLDKWRAENCASDCILIIGYDASEDFRFQPLKARMAPVNVRAPLLEKGIWKEQAYAMVEADGLRLPRLYALGFAHNNCGGFCVKAGQAAFANLLERIPERYAQHEAKEEEFRKFIGKDVSIMRDRRGGVSKPLTMRAFRERHQADPSLVDRSDVGGCTCMEEPEATETSDVLANPDQPISEGSWCDTLTHEMAHSELTIAGYERSDAGDSLSDPVVKYLAEQHSLRRQFPAKHVFSMTTDVADGRVVSVATCTCKQVFRFGSNDYLRMNAAIEAHWSRFSHEKTIDGRGQPINAEQGATGSQPAPAGAGKKRSRRSAPKAGGEHPSPATAALPEAAPVATTAGAASPDPGIIAALRAIERGEPVEGDMPRHLVGEGLAHATTKRLVLTDAGRALLASQGDEYLAGITAKIEQVAPIGAASEIHRDSDVAEQAKAVASGKPPEGEPVDPEAGKVMDAEAGGSPAAELARAGSDDSDDLAIDWPSYDAFIEDKIVTAPLRGIEVPRDALHPYLKPHCKDLTVWALRLGCAAIFAAFGLHKTAMQLEWCRQLQHRVGGLTLCVVPLGVRHGFIKEAVNLGMEMCFVRTNEEVEQAAGRGEHLHFLTNYESIREGKIDPNLFTAVSLDEASVLRSYGSKTFQEFLPLFAKVEFKLVATATPSPNRYKELIHYSGFLGVMDTGLALTRFFQRNSEKAGDLTLYPHKVDEFWMWMHSWAAFLQRPSELGYSDDGYTLPPAVIRWHEVPADHSQAEPERDGQGVMFRKGASSLQESAKARRDSLSSRVAKLCEIIAQDPDSHRILWHDLEAEREAIEQAVPGVVTISGSMDLDEREKHLHDFEEGRIKHFGTKPILSGSGSNFQYHCHKAVYVGLPGDGYKFNDWIQSLFRLQRFGQQHPVEIDIIYAEDMRAGKAALEEKWALDTAMRVKMSEIILRHGLNTLPLRDALLRSIGVKRVEVRGENFTAINNDAVEECRAWPENSVDLMVSSIPFGKQYEYSPSYRDFGHSDDNAHFWGQMDFLTSELLKMLKPGRLFCCHVKDRIAFGAVTGQGVPTVEPFHAEAIMHYRAHGFQYLGQITVVTDVVRENNQTYRLGWSENAKDGTKMGCGMPEYILLLRKPQSDRTRSYADVPVEKSKDDYTRARWQVDAHGFWRSSGNRHLTPEEFALLSSADLARMFAKTTVERIYDFEAHVKIGEAIERTGTLPATFMAIAPGSHHEDVWHDVNRMRTLNMMQQRKGQEQHLCPLQFDIVDRLIERYSNPGELAFDPFGGLMTVPYRALLKGRKGAAVELSATYFLDGVKYLQAAEEQMATPQLFDLAAFDAANTPPRGHDGGE